MFDYSRSPLVNGFVFKKRIVRALFRSIDIFHAIFYRKGLKQLPSSPRKILLSNLGGLGDVLIAARLIPALKNLYPQAEIGFLGSSNSKQAFQGLRQITNFHVLNHFYQLKSSLGLCKAVLHHLKTYKKALQEICSYSYDLAIDLQPFFPNAIPLLYAAKIPIRIGYPTAGFRSLLTHPFEWKDFGKYLGDLHFEHLKEIGLLLTKKAFFLEPCAIQEEIPEKFIALHMCSSKKEKNWKRESWIDLIQKLQYAGHQIVLTGQGSGDQEECDAVRNQTGCVSLCNCLNFFEYAALLQKANFLITVDSVSVHLAALYHIPTVVLLCQKNAPSLWIPSSCKIAFDAVQLFQAIESELLKYPSHKGTHRQM